MFRTLKIAVIVGLVTLGAVVASQTPPPTGRAPNPVLDEQAGTAFRPVFPTTNRLVTNEYAYWNASHPDAVKSPDWEMTSGSLFSKDGGGYSGIPDTGRVDALSVIHTNSAIFRLNTKRTDFGNVRVALNLNIRQLSSTSYTPPVAWDGVHIWLRYQSQYNLYYASVERRDGRVVIKKKCPGGPSNDGTYYELTAERTGYPIAYGIWGPVSATVQNTSNGTVTIALYHGTQMLVRGVDSGIGCAPITHAGATGVRGDNAKFNFTYFTVTPL